MLGTTRYVKYFIAQRAKWKNFSIHEFSHSYNSWLDVNNPILDDQHKLIAKFLATKETPTEIIGSFVDTPDNRRTTKWPNLKKAIKQCLEENATLLIAELGTFSSNEAFAKIVLESNIEFHCCDQTFVDRNILEALYKHAQIQKKVHGKLIRDGLKMTSAKSGNPNAAEVIGKVNKPKIHTAIIFADIIAPIITDYTKKGYSQRQMVKLLNEENFTAPEGGKWVLSQLQKVLDRVKINNMIREVGHIYKELKDQSWTNQQIAEEFNNRGIAPLKRTPWDAEQINKLEERIKQMEEIKLINNFINELVLITKKARKNDINAWQLMEQLNKEGIKVREFETAI